MPAPTADDRRVNTLLTALDLSDCGGGVLVRGLLSILGRIAGIMGEV